MHSSHGPRVLGGVGVCQGAVEVGGGPGAGPCQAGGAPFPIVLALQHPEQLLLFSHFIILERETGVMQTDEEGIAASLQD